MKKIFLLIMISLLFFVMACNSGQDVDEPIVSVQTPKPTPKEPVPAPTPKETEYLYHSIFNGAGMEEDTNSYQAVGVIIANTAAARPQSAIGLADIVYENAVETYTITRFLAIFASESPTKVGPVRSSRIPFVRIAQEWGIPYAHFGSASSGQGDAKSLVQSIGLPRRFDGHKGINDEFYSRDKSRKAPHNAYFNAKDARAIIPEIEYKKLFDFDKTSNIDEQDIDRLFLRYSKYNLVRYEYDAENKKYLRFINDQAMLDAYIDDQIRVTNIVLLHAPHRMVEKANYVLVDFLGEGKAEYFVNGKYEEGSWRKDSYEEKTEYFDSQGNKVVLLPGNTWVQVVHKNVEITKK